MTQEPIVRTYSGPSTADIEEAYRQDATQAASAGYVPISYDWEQNGPGLVLKVGYRLGGSDEAAAEAAAAAVPAYAPPVDYTPAADPLAAYDAYTPTPGVVDYPESGYTPPPVLDQSLSGEVATSNAAGAMAAAPSSPQYPSADVDEYARPGQYPEAAAGDYAGPTEEDQPIDYAEAAQAPDYAAAGDYAEAAPAADYTTPADYALAAPAAPAPAVPTDYGPPTDYPVAPQPRRPGRQAVLTVAVMDLHCAGEPLRLIRNGFPEVPSMPAADRRRWAIENADQIRRAIINEPRGHRDMYGAVVLPPFSDQADMAVLFMHNEGWSTMCGHGVIAVTTGLIEEGIHPATGPVTTIRYETPAGIVAANAATQQADSGEWTVQGVRFTNVPAYVAERSISIRPDGVGLAGNAARAGWLSVDLAFGGAYYGIVDAADLGLRVVPDQADALRRAGAQITALLRRGHTPIHPTDASLGFVYGTIIVDHQPQSSPDGRATQATLRNATIFADAELDRSPCGSGTSALLAQWHANGRLAVGQQIVSAGITGEYFLGRVESQTRFGPYDAVNTSIQGSAFVTGYSTLVVDARDPLSEGFLLR